MTGNINKLLRGDILLSFKTHLNLKVISLFYQVKDAKYTQNLNVCL